VRFRFTRAHASALLALAMFGGLAFWLLRDGAHQLREFADAWRSCGSAALAAAALAGVIQVGLQASRFGVVARESASVAYPSAARIFIFGQAANLFLPARAGDVGKVVATASAPTAGSPPEMASAAAILLADKFVDFVSMALLSLAIVPSALAQFRALPGKQIALFGGAALALVALIALLRPLLPANLKGKIVAILIELRQTIRNMTHPRAIFLAFAIGITAWVAEAMCLRTIAAAAGYPLSLGGLCSALIAVNVGTAIPVTPAQIGTFEASLAYGLSLAGVPLGPGLAIATMHHAVQMGSVVVWAVFAYASSVGKARRPVAGGQT
jgi:uncharacterized membrane protein YbhN (UPF0104 family)